MPHGREVANSARFQPNRLRQNRPATLDRLQLPIGGGGLQGLVHSLFQGFDLWPQAGPNGSTAGNGQDRRSLGPPALEG